MKAFPFSYSITNRTYHDAGMDLRDYFAAKIIQGMVANSAFESIEGMVNSTRVAYMIADAMMKARNRDD